MTNGTSLDVYDRSELFILLEVFIGKDEREDYITIFLLRSAREYEYYR
jgi:hypothetical protein